jgi:hypothetical protein
MQLAAQHLAEIVETVKKLEAANNGSDKRRFPRFNVIARVEVMHTASKRVYTALTRDLSLEGVGLLQSTPLNKGDEFSISLPRGKGQFVVARCTVAHAKELADGIWGIGAIFVTSGTQEPTAVAGDEARRIAAKMLG